MKISFVIPCYRSEKTIEKVYEEIINVIGLRQDVDYEIITVNDDSPDNVLDVLISLSQKDKKVKVIDCAKNMGKHAALMAGFRYAEGDFIVCTDDDCQCPMDRLWELIYPLENGYDVAMAQYGKKNQSTFKNFGSKMNDWMMTYMIGKPKEFQFSNFCAIKLFIIKEIIKYENPYSYVNGLILRSTNKIINVPMKERARVEGVSGYTFKKSLSLWINGATAFSILPLRIASYLGLFFSIISFCVGIIACIVGLMNPLLKVGVPIIISVIFFVNGLIMMFVGMLGEYVGRIYMCINREPQYIIRETWNIHER